MIFEAQNDFEVTTFKFLKNDLIHCEIKQKTTIKVERLNTKTNVPWECFCDPYGGNIYDTLELFLRNIVLNSTLK